jgi:hypothetical protein
VGPRLPRLHRRRDRARDVGRHGAAARGARGRPASPAAAPAFRLGHWLARSPTCPMLSLAHRDARGARRVVPALAVDGVSAARLPGRPALPGGRRHRRVGARAAQPCGAPRSSRAPRRHCSTRRTRPSSAGAR